jgi:hypothetical protein
MLLGNYQRALEYLHLDPGSSFEKTISIDVFLRQGKEKEALESLHENVPPWGGYDVVRAFLEHRSTPEVAALARKVRPAEDPEMNYFSAAHLAYCGQTEAALQLLREAIRGGYCSYPALSSDPPFAALRDRPEFAGLRSSAIACQNDFVSERQRTPKNQPR